VGKVIKPGIDVLIEKYVMAMKTDGRAPPRGKRPPEAFLGWMNLLKDRGELHHSCDEAGLFGDRLYRLSHEEGHHPSRDPSNQWGRTRKNIKTDACDAT